MKPALATIFACAIFWASATRCISKRTIFVLIRLTGFDKSCHLTKLLPRAQHRSAAEDAVKRFSRHLPIAAYRQMAGAFLPPHFAWGSDKDEALRLKVQGAVNDKKSSGRKCFEKSAQVIPSVRLIQTKVSHIGLFVQNRDVDTVRGIAIPAKSRIC